MPPFDLIIRGGRVIDPRHGRDAVLDVGIVGRAVSAVDTHLDARATLEVDATGQYVMPGLVDLHVHLSDRNSGDLGHAMLARAGVTTAIDLSGPVGETLLHASRHGAGLTIGVAEALVPGVHLPRRPSRVQIRAALGQVRESGAIGVKLHVDARWDIDDISAIVDESAAAGVWLAIHCGSTSARSDLSGLEQSLTVLGDRPAQIAHVNSYCRGDIDDPAAEADRAIRLLRAHPAAFGESYLNAFNAAAGDFVDGVPRSPRLGEWLTRGGYAPTRDGMRSAIGGGWAAVVQRRIEGARFASHDEGVQAYDAADGRVAVGLPLNPWISRLILATSRGRTPSVDGGFDVAALATDGGGLPRNSTLLAGLALVEFGALSLSDLVTKASDTPARLLGADTKGHLGVGADADVVVVDPVSRQPRCVIARGAVVYDGSRVIPSESTLLTSDECARESWAGEREIIDTAQALRRRAAITAGGTS